jgi:hypothetical protein
MKLGPTQPHEKENWTRVRTDFWGEYLDQQMRDKREEKST